MPNPLKPATPSSPASLQVGRIVVVQKNETEKKNPNSIRFLLGHLINSYFDGNLTKAAEELRKFGGRYKDDRQDRRAKSLTAKSITKLLEDSEHIAYWHLEVFSRYLDIPTGALLLLSRMFALVRYNSDPEVAKALAQSADGFSKVLPVVNWQALSIAEFDRVKLCFERLRAAENRSPTLF